MQRFAICFLIKLHHHQLICTCCCTYNRCCCRCLYLHRRLVLRTLQPIQPTFPPLESPIGISKVISPRSLGEWCAYTYKWFRQQSMHNIHCFVSEKYCRTTSISTQNHSCWGLRGYFSLPEKSRVEENKGHDYILLVVGDHSNWT